MEDILAIILIFGGGTLTALAFSPVGKAFADRIRHGVEPLPPPEFDASVFEELDRLRGDVTELQERLDFTERMLSKGSSEATDGAAS